VGGFGATVPATFAGGRTAVLAAGEGSGRFTVPVGGLDARGLTDDGGAKGVTTGIGATGGAAGVEASKG
jgi:hypothetical protein